jgi:hypothetical protein
MVLMVSLRIHVLKDKTLVDHFHLNVLFTVCHVSLPLRDEYTPHDLPILSTLDLLLYRRALMRN